MYNVVYDTPQGVKRYLGNNMTLKVAKDCFNMVKCKYLLNNGSPRHCVNGAGHYNILGLRVERVP